VGIVKTHSVSRMSLRNVQYQPPTSATMVCSETCFIVICFLPLYDVLFSPSSIKEILRFVHETHVRDNAAWNSFVTEQGHATQWRRKGLGWAPGGTFWGVALC